MATWDAPSWLPSHAFRRSLQPIRCISVPSLRTNRTEPSRSVISVAGQRSCGKDAFRVLRYSDECRSNPNILRPQLLLKGDRDNPIRIRLMAIISWPPFTTTRFQCEAGKPLSVMLAVPAQSELTV